mmetsp:Transcript_117958/g.333633  ORF Transcript_117958/g.333633 Transcript_117958/m.333633 type:complete len:203 (+) Transcript_117958:3-611(+)
MAPLAQARPRPLPAVFWPRLFMPMEPSTSSNGGGPPEASGDATALAGMAPGCATWQRTSLMIAARHGQLDVIDRALETSCSQPQLDLVDEHGNTALMIAAREGHLGVVKSLIGAGADLAMRNAEGQTAVDLAKTEDIREAIRAGEARMEMLLKAILAGASPGTSSAAASGSAGTAGLPAGFAALLAASGGTGGARSAGECPF